MWLSEIFATEDGMNFFCIIKKDLPVLQSLYKYNIIFLHLWSFYSPYINALLLNNSNMHLHILHWEVLQGPN